jgi:hypothetical protein
MIIGIGSISAQRSRADSAGHHHDLQWFHNTAPPWVGSITGGITGRPGHRWKEGGVPASGGQWSKW